MRKILAVTCLVLILITSSTFFGQFLKVGLLLGSPYAFWQGEKLVGIDYDIWKSVAQELRMQIEFYILPFSILDPNITPKLGLDVIAGGIHMADERKNDFIFGEPYLKSGLAIVLRKDLSWNGDVQKITFGVKKGATGEKVIQGWIKKGKKVPYKKFVSNEEIITNLLIKKIDAAFFDYLNALYLSQMYGLTVYKDLVYSVDVGFVVLNQQLKESLNKATKKMIHNNKIKKIVSSYVGKY